MSTILIIDDDEAIGNLEQEVLERAGYEVQRAFSGTEALLLLKQQRPDMILLDLMLPGISGEELLPQIQNIPVIVVSAKTGVDDKVGLLLGGAVDYLTKPFDTKELLARINIRLRESIRTTQFPIYNYGELNIDETSRKVSLEDKTVNLTRTEFAILKLLVQNPGQVIAKSVLLDRISLDTPDCTENSLKTHISHLRGKLRKISGKEYVESVWGIGFRWKLGFDGENAKVDLTDRIAYFLDTGKVLETSVKRKATIDKQFEYNTYIRDFFEDNQGRSLDEAITCWKYKKSLQGHNRYEKSDLVVLD